MRSACSILLLLLGVRSFKPQQTPSPCLVLIAGATGSCCTSDTRQWLINFNALFYSTGTGKTSLGMALAHAYQFNKCVSTDTIREIARTYSADPNILRPSYGGEGDAVADWRDACHSLRPAVDSVLDHTCTRRRSMVLEGVAIDPSAAHVEHWQAKGGFAMGVLLTISDERNHHIALQRRGYRKQVACFDRIRAIQKEMVSLARMNKWLIMEQRGMSDMIDEIRCHMTHDKKYIK